MKWIKRGLVYKPDANLWWQQHYAILPTPVHMPERQCIRIYFATTCKDRYGRITFIDVDENEPSHILYKHNDYILDVGEIGMFDDCGVNASSCIVVQDKIYMYYVGYQRCARVPYMLFPGLAIGDSQERFFRVSKAPVIERCNAYPYSFAAPFVLKEERFRMWFWIANKWTAIDSKPYLSASIGYAESEDGINWQIIKDDCIVPTASTEFSVGRPWILNTNGIYKMYYSIRYIEKLYRLGYAESVDGIHWSRKDNEIGIDVSEEGWDSEMICYPAVITVKGKTFLFYNGNNNGETGFGFAELAQQ